MTGSCGYKKKVSQIREKILFLADFFVRCICGLAKKYGETRV